MEELRIEEQCLILHIPKKEPADEESAGFLICFEIDYVLDGTVDFSVP